MYKLPHEVTLQIATPQAAKIYDTIGHHSHDTIEEIEPSCLLPRLRDTTGHAITLDCQERRASSEICGQIEYLKGIPGFTFSFTLTAIARI